MSPPKTVSRMDAGFEPPWMGLRRVFGGDTQFMSRCQCMRLIPLFTTDINLSHLAETRREPIRGGSASAADHHGRWKCRFCRSKKPAMRLTVSARWLRFISPGDICGTAVGAYRVFLLYLQAYIIIPATNWYRKNPLLLRNIRVKLM